MLGDTTQVAATGSDQPAEVPAEVPPAEVPPAGSQPAESPPVESPPVESPPVESPLADLPDLGDLDEQTTAMMDETVGQMIDSLDPQARAMLPPELGAALKKYKKWSKIPKAERAKLLAKLAGSTAAIVGGAAKQATGALDPPPPPRGQQIAGAHAAVPDRQRAGLGADGWVVPRRWTPSGYNPAKLGVEKYLPIALAEAKKLVPDAVLFRIDADGVYPDGHADITLTDNGSLDFRFISPSHAKRDPKLPVGAKQEWKCMFRVIFFDDCR